MLYYVTVPYADVSEAMGNAVEGFHGLAVTENDWIQATMNNGLIYDFDFGARCFQVSPGHAFEIQHAEMVKAGKITTVLGEAYLNEFLAGIRYWDGKGWAAEPTPVKR